MILYEELKYRQIRKIIGQLSSDFKSLVVRLTYNIYVLCFTFHIKNQLIRYLITSGFFLFV